MKQRLTVIRHKATQTDPKPQSNNFSSYLTILQNSMLKLVRGLAPGCVVYQTQKPIDSLLTEDQDAKNGPTAKEESSQTEALHWLPSPPNSHTPAKLYQEHTKPMSQASSQKSQPKYSCLFTESIT